MSTKIKDGCQSGSKVVTHNSKSDLPLGCVCNSNVKLLIKYRCKIELKLAVGYIIPVSFSYIPTFTYHLIFIFQNFHYDGQGPGAYFYAGASERPSNDGYQIPNEKGSMEVLQRYTGQNLVLSLPSGKTLRNVAWLSVWCEEFEVNFGEVFIPERFKYPRPQKISSFNGIHEVRKWVV